MALWGTKDKVYSTGKVNCTTAGVLTKQSGSINFNTSCEVGMTVTLATDGAGVGEGVIKKGTKRHKDAVEKKKIKNRKAVPYAALAAGHQPEGEVVEAKVDAGKSPEEKEKVRNVRKFGVSHNVAGHGKLRRSLHKMNRGDKKIPGDKSAWVEMEAYRVLASSDGQEKPSQFSYKDEKTAKKYADSIKKGGGKATVVKEDIGSFREYRANVEASKKRQQDKQDNRKKKDDAYIERVRKGIKFYDAKGSGRMVKGRKVYDKK